MRLLIIDPTGAALDLAFRCQEEGNEVRLFVKDTEKTKHIGLNLVTVVRDFRPWLHWCDLLVYADNVLYLRELDTWRAANPKKPVVGASQQAAEWELDREVGMEVLRKHGIEVPPYKIFNSYDKAIAYVKKENRRFVSKPSGDADKSLSYVAKSPADLVYMLARWKKAGKLKGEFVLQEFVDGCEMAVGGWFGPNGWLTGWCENFEHKKLMNDDLGVSTGEQGTVLRYVKTSKLASKVLEPLTESLHRLGYVGYIDVNCIIDEKGAVWPLEFTMRFGWPTFNIQLALDSGDPGQWLMSLAKGEDPKTFSLNRLALGIVMSIPDYPYSHITRKEVCGVPIYGLTPSLWPHVHLCEAMRGLAPVQMSDRVVDLPSVLTAGDYVLVMTATGETVKETKDRVLRRLKRLIVPNSPMYRTDIGERLRRQLPTCQKHGYATEMVYSTPA